MNMDDVIEVKKADPDSQFKLLPCKKCNDETVVAERQARKWKSHGN